MQNNIIKEIDQMKLPTEIKEKLESIIIDNVYIEYKHIEEIIKDLSVKLQAEILNIIYNYNKKLYDKEMQIKKELETIKKIKENSTGINATISSENITTTRNKLVTSKLDLDVTDYMYAISHIKQLDDLEEILPNSFTEKYEEYITKILLELKGELNLNYEYFYQTSDEEEKKNYKDEIVSIKEKIAYIKDYHEEQLLQFNEDEEIENTNIKNRIVYLATESGTPYALKDLKSIDSEYFPSFNILFQSIINGTFKNKKDFKNEHSNTFLTEVRGYSTRIIYDRIGPDTYIILKIFVKKINNDTYYQTSVADRCIPYKKQKDKLRKLIENPDYLAECEQITEEILKILKPRSRKGD